MNSTAKPFSSAVLARNPAWIQLLGLCPLMAVTSTTVNALGLALASAIVVIGSNVVISLLRNIIPDEARLPCFVMIIATFTTITTMLLEAFAFDLYLKIALFVQIIVTNCMILGRAESFASKQPPGPACLDALGTAIGFAIALVILGVVRELLAYGSILRDAHLLFGPAAETWALQIGQAGILPLAAYAPGAFLVAGILFAAVNAVRGRFAANPPAPQTDKQDGQHPDLRGTT